MAVSGSELVTVFGGSGFVGTQVVRELARAGRRVRVVVRKPHLALDLQPLGDVGQIQLMGGDVTSEDSVARAMRGASAVINLVGVLHGSSARFRALHAEAPGRIARACAAEGISRFVQVSAIGAEEGSDSIYARTKAHGEAAARQALPSTVVVRPSVVFGPGDGFLNRFASMAAISPALPLIGGGDGPRFQPVYVGDLARAIARAASDPACAGRTYELGGPRVYTMREVLELVMAETGRRRFLVPLPIFAASAIGAVGDVMGAVGITPPLTRDQVRQLQVDNVVSDGGEGLADLGVQPTGMEAIAAGYLWRYRSGGQFAELAASR